MRSISIPIRNQKISRLVLLYGHGPHGNEITSATPEYAALGEWLTDVFSDGCPSPDSETSAYMDVWVWKHHEKAWLRAMRVAAWEHWSYT